MTLHEVVDTVVRRWSAEVGALWFVVALVLGFLATRRAWWERSTVRMVVAAGIIVSGVAWAWSLLWASDDAFITFRYAEHFARGDGLVFNVGERVEGYTDFLWAVLIALCIKLGAPPGESGVLLSLASFVVALMLTLRIAKRLPGVATFPLALALTAANYSVASFATGGLETVFAMMLVLLALEFAEEGRYFLAGTAGVFAAMSHPDHLLFAGALGLATLWTKPTLRTALRFGAPVALFFVPWFLWRWSYYGDLFPNTYYAKSGGDAWFSQGVRYLLISGLGVGLPLLAPLIAVGAWKTRATIFGRFCFIALPLYLTYVAKIGGDFMFGRLLVSALPLFFLLAEAGLRSLAETNQLKTAAVFTFVAALALTPARVVRPGEILEGIADERTFTIATRFHPMEIDAAGFRLGHGLHETFTAKGLTPTVGIFSLGMAGYYGALPTFDLRGLASRSVAHQPLFERGRPGHEKVATLGQILEAKVDVSMIPLSPPPYDVLNRVEVGGAALWLRAHRPELMDTLRPHGLVDLGAWIDSQRFDEERARVECTAWHLNESWFSLRDDSARARRVVEVLQARDAQLASDVALMLEPPSRRGWKATPVFDFERNDGWSSEGDAGEWWVTTVPPRQQVPFGQKVRFVDTYTSRGDAAMGVLRSPEFVLPARALTLKVAGGFGASTRVELWVDGAVVRTARGCDSEWLGERAWDVSALAGRTASLRIVDENSGGWGHLLVDEFTAWD